MKYGNHHSGIEVRKKKCFDSTWPSYSSDIGKVYSYTFRNLTPGECYYFHVRAWFQDFWTFCWSPCYSRDVLFGPTIVPTEQTE